MLLVVHVQAIKKAKLDAPPWILFPACDEFPVQTNDCLPSGRVGRMDQRWNALSSDPALCRGHGRRSMFQARHRSKDRLESGQRS